MKTKTTENEKPMDDTFVAVSGTCAIEAAAAPTEGEEVKLPRVTMKAYNGGKMSVAGYGAVVVDLAGMEMSDVVPILYAHRTYDLEDIIGQTDSVKAGNTLEAAGAVMADTSTARKVLALSRNGYRFQVSIGAQVIESRYIPEDETVDVNGQQQQGPFQLVLRSSLSELSILPLGADKTTTAAIAASQTKEVQTMEGKQPDTPTAEDIRAAAVAEDTRIQEVRQVAKDHPDIAAKAVKDGWDKAKTDAAVQAAVIADLKAQIEAGKVQAGRDQGDVSITGFAKPALNAETIEAATALRNGLQAPEKRYSSDVLAHAEGLRISTLTDFFRLCANAAGKPFNAQRHDTEAFLRAAFSTASVSNIVSNLANKFILQGFGAVEDVWRMVTEVVPTSDFKTNTGVRLVMANLLKTLSPTGEIQHGKLSDETQTVTADTKALMLALTRKDIINDDLGAFTGTPQKLGFAAARTFNTDFWAAFVAAVSTAFPDSDANGNYHNVALSLAGMSAAEAKFLALTDSDGNPVGADAAVLLVSPTNATTARELFMSANLTGGSARAAARNVFEGRFAPAVTRYLTGAPWALVSNPMAVPLMRAAFLNGRQEPYVETAQADFNVLGIQMRCWYDYGVAFADSKSAVYSAGG